MSWYKKILRRDKKEVISSAIFGTIFALVFLLWHFALGKSFEWQIISPVSAPPLSYGIYSALVFVSLGYFLYEIGFYKLLADIIGRGLGDWELYRGAKKIIWITLILIVIYLVKKIVDLINTTISFFYNILNFILYIAPPLGISLVIFLVGYLIKKYVVTRSA